MKKSSSNWNIYCTRFLIRARQLEAPLTFVDMLGHEHHGIKGDYFVESVDGKQTILARKFFEDVYIPLGLARQRGQRVSERKFPPQSAGLAIAAQGTSPAKPCQAAPDCSVAIGT